MHTFDEVARYLDDIVDDLPDYIPQSLPGGIFLIPEANPHPNLPSISGIRWGRISTYTTILSWQNTPMRA